MVWLKREISIISRISGIYISIATNPISNLLAEPIATSYCTFFTCLSFVLSSINHCNIAWMFTCRVPIIPRALSVAPSFTISLWTVFTIHSMMTSTQNLILLAFVDTNRFPCIPYAISVAPSFVLALTKNLAIVLFIGEYNFVRAYTGFLFGAICFGVASFKFASISWFFAACSFISFSGFFTFWGFTAILVKIFLSSDGPSPCLVEMIGMHFLTLEHLTPSSGKLRTRSQALIQHNHLI